MATATRGARSWASATTEVVLSAAGAAWFCYPALALGNDLAGGPVAETTVGAVVGVLALATAYTVVTGNWTVDGVWTYATVLVGTAVGVQLLGGVVVLATGATVSGGTPAPQALAFGVAYPVTVLAVRHRRG